MRKFIHKKSLGQNFLIDNNIINKIIDNINPTVNDLIIEIGPGEGALTKKLIKKNCDVLCFEIDKRLEETLNKIKSDKLKIEFVDFLKINLKKYINKEKYKNLYFIGNLPYYITTAIINKIINESDPYEIIIMVQKEVGERFMSSPNSKSYNSLSVYLQYNFDIEKIIKVSKNCFNPIPKVDSVVLKMKKNKKYICNDEDYLYKLIKDSFTQKRKNLKNNLKNYDLKKLEIILNTIGKNLSNRAEEISVKEFVHLANEMLKKN